MFPKLMVHSVERFDYPTPLIFCTKHFRDKYRSREFMFVSRYDIKTHDYRSFYSLQMLIFLILGLLGQGCTDVHRQCFCVFSSQEISNISRTESYFKSKNFMYESNGSVNL